MNCITNPKKAEKTMFNTDSRKIRICIICEKRIKKGDKVVFNHTKKIMHKTCADKVRYKKPYYVY